MVWRTRTARSAAVTGSAAATDSSNCPGAYSGWNCSTGTSCASSAASRSSTYPDSSTTRVMPYAGPAHAGVASASPTNHSTSNAARRSNPRPRARSMVVRANVRWQHGYGWSSWVSRSTGAQAHPGWAASAVTRSRSGYSRRSPAGPPTYRLVVIESSTQNTSNTGDMPIPHAAA